MTNPPPQWLIDLLDHGTFVTPRTPEDGGQWEKALTREEVAAAITAKFEQACGEDEKAPLYGDPLPKGMSDWERDIILAENVLRAEQRTAWYTDDSREGDKNATVN